MTKHGNEHEDFLQRVLTGEPSAQDQQDQASRLRECPECRSALQRLRALDQDLRSAVGQQRADLARASTEVVPADELRVRRSLEEALATLPRRAAGRRSRRILWSAAAALLLLLAGWSARAFLLDEPTAEILLGGGDFECLEPLGAVAHYDVFRWDHTPTPLGSYELRIHELSGDQAGKLVYSGRPTEPRWTPEPEVERALPSRIYWEVIATDEDTGRRERGFAKAWRP